MWALRSRPGKGNRPNPKDVRFTTTTEKAPAGEVCGKVDFARAGKEFHAAHIEFWQQDVLPGKVHELTMWVYGNYRKGARPVSVAFVGRTPAKKWLSFPMTLLLCLTKML